jgi:stearoyl-CoA desaturase (delta-9 desaturase)
MQALVENQPIMWFDGLVDLSLVGYIAVTLVLTHITIASVTIFLHRCQAHRALSLHPLASHFFRFWLWLTTGMVTQEWVAVHRKHHARCETDADPHSPQTKGIWRVLFLGAWLYREETQKQETLDVYGRFTPNDWLEKHVYGRYRFLGIELMFVIDVLLFGAAGAFIFLVQMLWIPFWAAGVINGVGHYLGYRNFETQDASRNIVPLGILVGGEEFHNNHHAYAYSAKLSNHWWEFDIGWFYIRMLERLGLAKVKRVLPRTSFAPGKTVIDSETLRAVIGNRFHVLKLYGRGVIAPVLLGHAEDGFSRRLLARIRRLMIREDATAPHEDLPARRALELALERSATLRTVYQSMQQLKALWGHSIKTDSDRLNRLQAWCTEAEASGIRALRDFARQLQAYTAQAA